MNAPPTTHRRELKLDRCWLIGLTVAVLAGAALLLLLWPKEGSGVWRWLQSYSFALAVAAFGIPTVQLVTTVTRNLAAVWSKLEQIPTSRSRAPQRMLGLAETIAYTVGFAALEAKDVLTAAGAVIVLKQFGSWSRWMRQENGPPSAIGDDDEKRARFYVFLVATMVQVGAAGLVGYGVRAELKRQDHVSLLRGPMLDVVVEAHRLYGSLQSGSQR